MINMASADVALTLMIMAPENRFKYVIEVVKSRSGSLSRHEFPNLKAALHFMEGYMEKVG